MRDRLSELNVGDVQVQEFGSARDLLIRIEAQGAGDNAEQSVVDKVRAALQDDYEFRRIESVGPTVSGELAWAGTIGVLASLLAMLIYIWFRFEWQFGLGAVIATVHDVIMMVGLYALSGIEFNLTSIAAILTVVGYSINDTVVVYDRVRENLRKYKKMPIEQLLDLSMNQTLSRTILTGVTTLLALCSLYLFGGEVIRSFTFAMIFGILVGTYSSIFVAGPLLILFNLRPAPRRRAARKLGSGDGAALEDVTAAMAEGIVIREAHFPGRAPVDAYGNGGFRFAEMSHRGSILCLPSGIHGWEPADPAALDARGFRAVSSKRPRRSRSCWSAPARSSSRCRRRCARHSGTPGFRPTRCRPARQCAPTTCFWPRIGPWRRPLSPLSEAGGRRSSR